MSNQSVNFWILIQAEAFNLRGDSEQKYQSRFFNLTYTIMNVLNKVHTVLKLRLVKVLAHIE